MSRYVVKLEEDVTGDLVLPLPSELLKELGWNEGDELTIEVRGDSLVISNPSKVKELPPTWKHFCMIEKHYIETGVGQPCNWCGETENH